MLLLLIFVIYILVAEIFVHILTRRPEPRENKIDVILLLGANGDINSPVTRDRALNAALAKEHYPNARLLLSGNESQGEITAYKKLLAEHGHLEVIIETESTTTWENLKLSKILLENLSSHDDQTLIVTSEYHQKRSLAMARCLGFEAYAGGKDPRRYKKAFLHFLKERFSIWKYFPQMLFNYILF